MLPPLSDEEDEFVNEELFINEVEEEEETKVT